MCVYVDLYVRMLSACMICATTWHLLTVITCDRDDVPPVSCSSAPGGLLCLLILSINFSRQYTVQTFTFRACRCAVIADKSQAKRLTYLGMPGYWLRPRCSWYPRGRSEHGTNMNMMTGEYLNMIKNRKGLSEHLKTRTENPISRKRGMSECCSMGRTYLN